MVFLLLLCVKVEAQWTPVPAPVIDGTELGAMHYKDGTLWAGNLKLYYSRDEGQTWTESVFPQLTDAIMSIDFFDRLSGLVGTRTGAYLTRDGGLTWTKISSAQSAQTVVFGATTDQLFIQQYTPRSVFFSSMDGGMNWRAFSFPPDVYTWTFVRSPGGLLHVFAYFSSPVEHGRIYTSNNNGLTFFPKAGTTDGDCYTLAIDACDTNRLYLANEDVVSVGNDTAEVYLSTDAGDTWEIAYAARRMTAPGLSGSVITTGNAIYVGKYENGVLRSTDQGQTWTDIGGPWGNFDSRQLCAVNENTLFMVDRAGLMYKTTNSGGFPLPKVNVVVSPPQVFTRDSVLFCENGRVDSISLVSSFCRKQKILTERIIGQDADDYTLLRGVSDSLDTEESVTLRFYPSDVGGRSAIYQIILEGGDTIDVPLGGFGIVSTPLAMQTQNVATDTIGGRVSIPIIISGFTDAEDIELVVHYDDDLEYVGSTLPGGTPIDIPAEQWKGRSKLRILNAVPDEVLGYANFDVYADTLAALPVVTFDSLAMLDTSVPCKYILPAPITAIVTPPSGCGITILSRFAHLGEQPTVSVYPNPAIGSLSIIAAEDIGTAKLRITTISGETVLEQMVELKKHSEYTLAVSFLPSGVYTLEVGRIIQRFVLSR